MNTNHFTLWNNRLTPLNTMRDEVEHFFDSLLGTAPTTQSRQDQEIEWQPACDIEEVEDHFLLTLDMPGVPKDRIKLEIVNNHLIISGERPYENKRTLEHGWYSERRQGRFQRTFALSARIDENKVEANYQDGILRVYVPKADSEKPKQIKISHGTHSSFFEKLTHLSSTKNKEERHPLNQNSNSKVAS